MLRWEPAGLRGEEAIQGGSDTGILGEVMKKALLFAAALLTITATGALAGISGSKHDFSGQGWSGGQICKPCHTPHNADTTISDAPLWNHAVTSATYTLYSSPTLDAVMEQPGGVSKLCLSCHDGTVAIDSFGGNGGSTFMAGPPAVGRNADLSDDHPVSFDWGHESNTGGSCSQCHQSHPWAFISPLPFFDGRVECATCHDPHNAPGFNKMLRMTMAGSALCRHCHSNK